MMRYTFDIWFTPDSTSNAEKVVAFLTASKTQFHWENLYQSNGKEFELDEGEVLAYIASRQKRMKYPEVGLAFDVFNRPPQEKRNDTVRIEFHVGTEANSQFLNWCRLDFGDEAQFEDSSFIRSAVNIFNPIEAYVAEAGNESQKDTYGKQQKYPKRNRAVLVRGIHFFGKELIESHGGIEKFKRLPVYKLEELTQGILVTLTNTTFNPNELSHIEQQTLVSELIGAQ